MQKSQSVIYVNFAQYENVGRILDYLRENFSTVVHFSYDHLRLKRGRPSTFLRVFQNGILVKEVRLIRLAVPEVFHFPTLPLLAVLMVIQTVWHTILLRIEYQRFDYYLTLDAFSTFIGGFLRGLGLVKKNIFWVGDYFPLDYPDWRIRLLRWTYWKFDKYSMLSANRLIFTNQRLLNLYKEMKILPKYKTYSVVAIGSKPQQPLSRRENCIIGFLGMIKNSQGLELIFDILPKILKHFPTTRIEIIGSGPDEDLFRQRARRFADKVTFYGFIESQDKIHDKIKRWTIGLAPYQPVSSNESYWGDPSKIKVYLSVGVPVITTDVSYIAQELRENKAGVVIDYYNHQEFIEAIKTVLKNKQTFQKNAFALAKKYDYRTLYPEVFKI